MNPCLPVSALTPALAAVPLGLRPLPTAVQTSVQGADLLLPITIALGLAALAALRATVKARRTARTAARSARHHAQAMRELLRTIRLAEGIAGIGVWQYDPRTGAQDWSPGMRRIFGVDPEERFVAGDAETLLFANNVDLVARTAQYAAERTPYTLEYTIAGDDGADHAISVQACNLFAADGTVARIVAVVRDITEQLNRERALEQSRHAALAEADRARREADTDALTGLANRRRVMADLDQFILASRRAGRALTLAVLDIDRFKAINDTHGHLQGDRVLQRLARIAQDQARAGDLVGRLGGEEFVWIMPGPDLAQAQALAERLRNAVARESCVGEVPAVTISAGLAELRGDDTSLSLFARADAALYRAKNAGRNRVQLAA